MKSKEGGTPFYVRWEYIYKEQIRESDPGYIKWAYRYFITETDFMAQREEIVNNIDDLQEKKRIILRYRKYQKFD